MDFKKPNIYNLWPLKVEEPNSNQKSLKVAKPNSVKIQDQQLCLKQKTSTTRSPKQQNQNKIIKSKQRISRNITRIISSR